MSRKISPEAYVQFADRGESNRAIGRRFGVDESTVRRALESIGYRRDLIPVGESFEDRFNFVIDKPLEHRGDLMITADWHIPLYDPGYVNEMLRTARMENLTSLVIAGDFFNFDALSQYDPKQGDAGLERELREGVSVMRVLLETFEHIYYLWGNHDARLHRALGFAMQFQEAMKMVFGSLGNDALDRVTFTNLDHMWVTGQGDTPWYLCHPKAYSRVPLSNAIKLAAKMNTNVACAHSHHCAVGYAVNGTHVVAELGGLFDRTKTAYLQRSTSFPTWQQGYGYLRDGALSVRSPGWNTVG